MNTPTSDQQHKTNEAFLQLLMKMNERRSFAMDGGPFGAARRSLHADCQAIVADPKKALWLRAVGKKMAHASAVSFTEPETTILRALTTGDSGFGQATSLAEPVAADIYNMMLRHGAFRTLGVVPVPSGKTKLVSVTGKADAIWLTPANQGTSIPPSGSVLGSSISPECATLGALVEVSGEALADGKTTFEAALLMAIVGAHISF